METAHTTAPAEIMTAIEQHWKGRTKTQNLPNPKSPRYRDAEVEFFSGAMAALDACGYSIAPKWAMRIISGQNVVTP